MTNAPSREPSLRVLQAALRKTTETLASELARPTSNTPSWSPLEWLTARAVVAIHGVGSLLSSTLLWEGPAGWERFLQLQRLHTTNRHRRMEELLQTLDTRLKEAGIAAVALKGTALYAYGLYSPGERPMADIDLLVRDADARRTVEILEALRFNGSLSYRKNQVFAQDCDRAPAELGEDSDNDIKIELHESICERLPLRTTDISERVFPPRPRPGLNPYPSTASLMTHVLFHAAGEITFRTLRLVHLHDIALLSSRMRDADWDEFLRQAEQREAPWWALPPLMLTTRYYGCSIPQEVMTEVAARCSWPLSTAARHQRLSDVSLSRLRIQAFPGIEWSQSWIEMLRYVLKRLRPDAEHLTARQYQERTDASCAGSAWCSLPQYKRVLQWVISRPARPAAMHPVRAALAQRL